MSARSAVQRAARPRRRSRRPGPTLASRRQALERLLEERNLLVRRMLHEVRERHPLAAGGMDMEDRVQADLPRELDASLLEKEAEARQLVEDALRRSEQGDDERCTQCGEPIGRTRLRAVPFTDVCRACKDAEEDGTHSEALPRPIPITP